MNVTIAVALITAISTLLGGLIAGVISLRIAARQANAQRQLAKDERQEQQASDRRKAQREIYVQLLNHYDEIERCLHSSWQEHSTGNPSAAMSEVMTSGYNSIIAFEEVLNIIALETPLDVAVLAMRLKSVAANEMQKIAEYSVASTDNTLINYEVAGEDAYQALTSQRADAKLKLIITAKNALEGTNIPLPEVQIAEHNNS